MYNPKKSKKKLSDFFQDGFPTLAIIIKKTVNVRAPHIYKQRLLHPAFLYHINNACGGGLSSSTCWPCKSPQEVCVAFIFFGSSHIHPTCRFGLATRHSFACKPVQILPAVRKIIGNYIQLMQLRLCHHA